MNDSNMVEVLALKVTKMTQFAELEEVKHNKHGGGIYGHNNVHSAVTGYMGEYGVKVLYARGGIDCHQNIKNNSMPDLTVFAHKTLETSFSKRSEEVKSWKSGGSWERYGKTITAKHAQDYFLKGIERVWFVEVNRDTNVCIIHGWATPEECLQANTIETSSGTNHQLEVLHRVHEVMSWVDDDTGGWF